MLKKYVVLDLETTGLSKHYHKITEIAAVKIKNNKITEKFEELVNPNVKIPSFITRLTGITNKMVKNKPNIKQILPEFLDFLEEDMIIAHNATFDHGFLNENAKKHLEQELLNQRLCTRKLAYRLLNHLPSKRLETICIHYNIENKDAHRAMSDVKATYKIFKKFNNLLHKKGIKEKEDILKFENSSLRKLREKELV
ncbi:3'-5' exonuclease [Candidatus Woesearchaeota archaeon]|nr:3'-5' exonuclease [Candidatus Woesearchaeota archaeon]